MAFLQGNSNASGSGGVLAFVTANVTAGSLLVSVLRCNKGGVTTLACSDNVNGAWSVVVSNLAGGVALGFAYRLNSAGGSKPTVTWTGFSAGGTVCIGEYSGVNTFRTVSTGATATSTAVASDSITATNGDLLIGFEAQVSPPVSIAATNSYTLREGGTDLATQCVVSLQDKISAGGSESSTDTLGSSQQWTAAIAAFYTAVAGGSVGWVNRHRKFINKR